MSDNCWTCDRPRATDKSQWPDSALCFTGMGLPHAVGPGERCPQCSAERDCNRRAVDWRARALAAEAERDSAIEREARASASKVEAWAQAERLTLETNRLREALAVAGVQEVGS